VPIVQLLEEEVGRSNSIRFEQERLFPYQIG